MSDPGPSKHKICAHPAAFGRRRSAFCAANLLLTPQMRNLLGHALVLALSMTAFAGRAAAQEPWFSSPAVQLNCMKDHFDALTTVSGLPSEVRAVILKDGRVADYEQPWEATDVPGTENLPYRRLAMAALGERRIFAAVEVGGGPNYLEVWSFERTDGKWQGKKEHAANEVPRSLTELLYLKCHGYQKPVPRPKLPQRPIHGFVGSDGALFLVMSSEPFESYELKRDPALRGTREYDDITNAMTFRKLSLKERAALRTKLKKLRATESKADAGYQVLIEYLNALDSDDFLRTSH